MWTINKEFEFDYGHRVHSQRLNPELSIDTCLVCRHLHGHRGKVVIHLSGEELDDKGMVLDFKELNWFKKFVDDVLDHKMIIDINDPALKSFFPFLDWVDFPSDPDVVDGLCEYHISGYYTVKLDGSVQGHLREIYEGLVLVNFVPTSENLAKWIFDIVTEKLKGYAIVEKVEFHETPKTCSTYSI